MPTGNRNNTKTKKHVLKWVKRALGALFLLAVAGMLVTAWMPKPLPVDLAEVERGALEVTVDEDGRTRVKDRYIVSAPISGNLARIELNPGDAVEEGAILARILPFEAPLLDARTRAQAEARVAASRAGQQQARAMISRVEAATTFATREAQRQRTLLERGSVSEQVVERADLEARTRAEELRSARFASRVAEHEVRMARAALGQLDPGSDTDVQMEVPSPVAARVLRVLHESEGAMQVGTPLLELGEPGALEIVVDVLTSDAVHIEPGAEVRIERWGGETALAGHVRRVEPSAFTRMSALGVEEQRVNVLVDLDDPQERWQALGDGYRVEAHIVIWENDDVLKLPASAVFRQTDGWAAYTVVDGKAHLVPVEIGRRSGFDVQVLEGLDEGDVVIVHPSDRVIEGVEVVER